MKIALVGFELEGRAAYDYWSGLGADITICDQDAAKKIPDGVKRQLGEGYLKNLDQFDVIWRTAGINPAQILQENPGIKSKITTTMNEFLRVCPTKNVIGVTGTKGKGTTSTLIFKMLEACLRQSSGLSDGKQVFLGGNIGVSPLEFLPKLDEKSWVVLELSSYQLEDQIISPHISVCLMVVPEHLDRHENMQAYVLAKSNLFAHQTVDDIAIYFADNKNSRNIAAKSPGKKIPYFAKPGAIVEDGNIVIDGKTICKTNDLKLLGEHNWQNACAAITTVWQISKDIGAIRSVLITFSGLPHRLEFVREIDSVKYYNDSFASTPDASMAALEAIKQPKVLIMGGFDRNLPLEHLAESISDHNNEIRKIVIIGASAHRLSEEFEKAGFTNYRIEPAKTMDEIVTSAKSLAKSGDAVVLSPGFASFDMFKNFEDRGLQFKAAVEKL